MSTPSPKFPVTNTGKVLQKFTLETNEVRRSYLQECGHSCPQQFAPIKPYPAGMSSPLISMEPQLL